MVTITKETLACLNAGKKPKRQKGNKYKAVKVTIDGYTFDSKKEGARYQELKLQQHCGVISDLQLQPEFLLQEGFKSWGKWIRPMKYVADFKYQKGGDTVVEDVKGKKTKEYLIKKKLFLKKYPEYRFLET